MPKTADQLKWEGDGARICCQHQWQESWVINEARSWENLCSFPMKWTHNKKAQNRPLVVGRTRQPEVASSRLHLLSVCYDQTTLHWSENTSSAKFRPKREMKFLNIVFGCRIIFYPTYYGPNQVKRREEMLQNQMRNLSKSNVKYVQS